MSYYLKPTCPCSNGGVEEGRKESNSPSKCCIPCGSLGYPKKTQEYEHIRNKRSQPLLDMLETDRKMALRINIENHAHTRKIIDNAKYKTKIWLEQESINLEAKRDKLKLLMEDEDEMYKQEMIQKFESKQTNRIDEMRARVAQLKDVREQRHKAIVEKKYDQAFQSQCEQMRKLMSKRITREIAHDRDEQLRQKRRLECEAEDEERMWAYLWNKDAEEKWKREQAYLSVKAELTKQGLLELKKQIESKQLQKEDYKKIRIREAGILEADRIAMEADKKKWEDEKEVRFLKNKASVKDMMETRDFYRDKRVKREEVVAREFLKRAVRELYAEKEDRGHKKKELMNSIQIYREYLQKRDCLENAKEEALQRIIDGVIEEQYEKVMTSRKNEHDQRRKLFENVLAGRSLQLEDLKNKRNLEEIERQKHEAALKEDWNLYLREVEAEKQKHENKRLQYRKDLDCQVVYNEKVKEREKLEIKRENELCDIEERLFNNRLNKTLNEANLAMSNPYRQPFVGKHIKQCLQHI